MKPKWGNKIRRNGRIRTHDDEVGNHRVNTTK